MLKQLEKKMEQLRREMYVVYEKSHSLSDEELLRLTNEMHEVVVRWRKEKYGSRYGCSPFRQSSGKRADKENS
ncbi:Spo0E family sporulation regulatory protein-aspartic acid phosphatase [Sediminibacillus dalangtanensis]|uniref:Spo0E family sporulation regulatory protein-aspartic acid phosphatase n=1 Tax=Sediminibacillus dalangtanensis TaxID=2729421 RepID=A0ABX7VW37_9BACI|nr:Spo0E family sporulation regulatory protein-aspartic acid phosphatase [Sediminibacillus dalangtanensis]QTM98816.1 Spo0E family sporulation regulatory protein-aspartic acid phosphatase [Sediminibacillus dalangtanensis]